MPVTATACAPSPLAIRIIFLPFLLAGKRGLRWAVVHRHDTLKTRVPGAGSRCLGSHQRGEESPLFCPAPSRPSAALIPCSRSPQPHRKNKLEVGSAGRGCIPPPRSLRASLLPAGPLALRREGRSWRVRGFFCPCRRCSLSPASPGHRQSGGPPGCGLRPSPQFIGELRLFLHGNYLPPATCEGAKPAHLTSLNTSGE